MKKLLPLTLLLALLSLSLAAQTIVERHGQLRVDGNRIVDECDRTAQLKGMSYFWSQWEGTKYYNANTVKWLRDDWNVEIVRASLGVNNGDGIDYISRPAENFARVTAVLDGAVEHGVYGIADFHAHYADRYLAESKTFFDAISRRYADAPNIVYEIWNEPIGGYSPSEQRQTWATIKAYSRELISVIRDNDPNGIIVLGTPFYSQGVDVATADPITTDSKGRPVGNVAYSLHFYAGTHTGYLRDKGDVALDRGFAIFMTECGRTLATGDGGVDDAEWDRWEAWMDANGISYAKWAMNDKPNETSSVLLQRASANGGWSDADLTDEGRWSRDHFRTVNANKPSVCDDGGGNPDPDPDPNPDPGVDDLISVSAPGSVPLGGSVTVPVEYSASTDRDLYVVLQLDSAPWTVYAETKVDLRAGSGTLGVELGIPANLSTQPDIYQIQTYLTTDGGSWNSRLDNIARTNVDAVAPPPSTTAQNVFTEGFDEGWANWSWFGSANSAAGGAKFGSRAFSFAFNDGGVLSFGHGNGKTGDKLVGVEFWARVTNGSQRYRVSASSDHTYDNRSAGKNITVGTTYRKFTVSRAELGDAGWLKRFYIEPGNGGSTLLVDDFKLVYEGVNARQDPAVPETPELTVWPNPSGGDFALELTTGVADPSATLELTDRTGRVVDARALPLGAGANRFELDYEGRLAPGVYHLRVVGNQATAHPQVLRVVIQ